MPFAVSSGCRIYYRLEGVSTNPLLVLVHSLGADHGMWDPQMPALQRYFRVLRIDLRGHGASDAPAGDYSIELLASDVLAAADAAGGESFAYCGLSLGGMIGQWLSAHVATRIRRMVLANTSPRMADPNVFNQRRQAVSENGMGSIVDAVMQRFFTARTLASHDAVAESVRAVFLSTDPTGYGGCCAAIRDMDQTSLLARIRLPTLVIGGDEDVSTPWVGHGDLLAREISGAKAVLLHAAHLSNVDRPSAFTSALFDFLLPPRPDDLVQAGFAVRRLVLGDAHVDRSIESSTDFNRDFQEFITRSVWGTVWTRPLLDPRVRRLLVLAMTSSLGRWEEFRLHVKTGLASELELADLKEVLLQVAPYAGVPAANTGFQIAAEEVSTRNSGKPIE